MDFHSMKRKQLQALCKKHNIPANLSNLEMANRISEILKGKEDPQIQRSVEGQDENVSEAESADAIVNKKVKKVRFSPEHELIEFSKSPQMKRRSRRSMAVSKSGDLFVVNVSCSDMGRPGRALRSRGLKSMDGNIIEKNGKNPEKGKGVNTDASAIEILDNGKSQGGDVDSSGQEMPFRGKNRSNKRAKDDGKSHDKASENIDNEKLIQKIVDNPGRVTRSRVQKLTEVPAKEESPARKVVKRTGNAAQVIAENVDNKAVGTSSDADEVELANGHGVRGKSKGKSLEEDLENKIVEEHVVNEPQIVRRSRRNRNGVADSEMLFVDKRKNENGEGNGLRKKSKLMATNGSGVGGEGSGCEVDLGKAVSLKIEKPIKVEPRRNTRRKNVIEADELKTETENGHPSRFSALQLGTADESSKDEKKVLQPTGVTGRSRRKTLSVKIDTQLVVENLEAETENGGVLRSSVQKLGTDGETSKDEKKVVQPSRVMGRSRRKTITAKSVSEDETETKCLLSSVPEFGIVGEVSKDEKKILQPTGGTRRSRRKTLSVKIVSTDTHLAVEKLETETESASVLRGSVPQLGIADEVSKDEMKVLQTTGKRMTRSKTSCFKPVDEENDTNLNVENLNAEELKTEKCLIEKECSAVQQSTRRITSQCKSPVEVGGDSDKAKRKIDVMKTNNDPNSIAETMKETSSKEAVPTASSGKVADSGKRRCRLDDYKLLDASSHNALEVGEGFVAKVQPSGSEGLGSTSNLGVSNNTSADGTHGKKPDASLADNEGNFDMKLINGNGFADSDVNATPRNMEFKKDADFQDDEVSVKNTSGVEKDNSPLEIDTHELLEQNMTDVDKNDPEAHVLIETEDLGCNKVDNQVLPEGSNVSGSECFDETGSSTDSLPRGDHTEIKTVMEVRDAEVHICLQPTPNVVDRVDEAKGISVEENLASDLPRKDNQVTPACSKISEQETLAETTSSADNSLPRDQTDIKTDDVEVAEVEAENYLQQNPCVDVEHKVIAAQENLYSDETGQDDQVLPEVFKDSGKENSAETGFSADSRLFGGQTDIMTDLEVAQAEGDKCIQLSPNVVDHVGVVKGVFVQENLDVDEIGKDDQALPEVSNDSEKEGSAETSSSTDSHLLGDQTDTTSKFIQPSPSVVDHVGVVKGVFVQENMDVNEIGKDDQALPEVSNDSEKEGSAETSSSTDGHLLGDQTDITTDLEVAQTEADKCLHPSPIVVDHVGVFEGVSVQENLVLDETRKGNQEGSNVGGNEGFADQTDTTDPELANAEGDKRLQPSPSGADHEEKLDLDETKQAYTSSPVSCNRIDVYHLEKSDNILDNDNENTPPKAGSVESCEKPTDYNHSRGIMTSKATSSCVLRRHAGDNMTAGNEAFFHKVSSELAETDEYVGFDIHKSASYRYSAFSIPDFSDGEINAKIVPQDNLKKGHEVHTERSPNSEGGRTVEGDFYHKSRCDEHGESIVSNLFEAEARPGIMPQDIEAISEEYSLKDFDEQGMCPGSPSVAPTTICNSAKDHELDLIFEGYEASTCKDKQSEIVGADESVCLESHKSPKDEDWEFNISNLFDGERSARIKDSYKKVAVPDVPAMLTTCENYNEVKFNADGSNLQKISPSKSVGVSESQEQLKIPLAGTTAVSNIIHMPETCWNAIETAGNVMCLSKTSIVGTSADDANDAECGKEIDDCTISKIGDEGLTDIELQDTDETEEQSKDMLEKESKPVIGEKPTAMKTIQSWTEIELHNLFGTIFDTPGPNDTSSSRTEAANLTPTNKSISKSHYSLTKKETEIGGERSESEKIKNEIVVLPTSFSEVSHGGLKVDMEENQLAMPITKNVAESHGRELDGTVISFIKCSETMKENVVTQSKSDEKDTLSDNGEGVTGEGINEVESGKMVNISSTVLSEAEYGGCGASEEQLTENTVECLKETNLKVEEDKVETAIPLLESCLHEEPDSDSKLMEKNCISYSVSPKNLVQLESCQDMITDTVLSQSISCKSRSCQTTAGDIAQSGEAGFGLSDTDLQRPKKSDHLAACSEGGSILRKISVETSRGRLDEEVADISIFGTSPCLFSKFLEHDEVTKQGESARKDNDLCGINSRSSQDISRGKLEGDHEIEKIGEEAEESLTASMDQFLIPQLHFEEHAEGFNINIHNISDVSPSECSETLKESDVADTIKEYIDSESSLSMISENSSLNFPNDEMAQTNENAALSENIENVAERFMNTENIVDHLEIESKELESPACVDILAEVSGSSAANPLVETKGFDVKLDSQKQIEAEDCQKSSFKQLCSTTKKNARTILIHGTPGKVPATVDMKENAPMHKSSNVGDLTAVRPVKRKALQDVRWK